MTVQLLKNYTRPLARRERSLVEEIRRTVTQLHSARCWFETECDADLIESSIYQLEALEARYRYLLKMAKDCGVKCDALTGEVSEKRTA
ncbi:MAG: YaaL family protein [Oscillospiraceae bacterium]|nr:YaaL family protein [Oscillospiraceae bacterium]